MINSLRNKLIIGIGIILLVAQIAGALTIWHESIESIEIMLDTEINQVDRDKKITHEIREIIFSLTAITLAMLFISFIVIYVLISKLTEPLEELVKQLKHRDGNNLQPIEIPSTSTEIQTVTDTLNQVFEQHRERFEQEKQFTADVAHELRTPLAGLRVHLELLSRKEPSVSRLIMKIDEMIKSIELLLQLARTESLVMSGQLREIDLINEVILPLKNNYTVDFPHELNWEYPAECRFPVDTGLLSITLSNLLENVRKHATNGTETTIHIKIQKNCLNIELIDNGIGIDTAELDRLLQPFEQLERNDRNLGWGLGLNLVKRIIRVHEGTLKLKSRTDGLPGLCIEIMIPNLSLSYQN